MREYNIYCDESCHLEHDDCVVMVLGALWCPKDKKQKIFDCLKEIKVRHGFSSIFEIKWNKVSPAKVGFYIDLVNYFFDDNDLHFRTLIVPDKSKLDHAFFNHTHDVFYYKMYFDLLKVIFEPDAGYNIYLDLKDTQGWYKIKKLEEILRSSSYDFSHDIIRKIQEVHSREVVLIQLADLLTGAVAYANRDLTTNSGKLALVNKIRKRSGYTLKYTTLLREQKFNIFRWQCKQPK